MPPSNAMENDKKRLRNQFTKDERTRLLAIMTEYGPLLDDKNISILSRKEIWEIIENKFNENGHSGRTSAQLKKYWQNYKYHSKRTKIIHKEVPKPLSPMTKHMVRMLAKVNPDDWAQYDVALNTGSIKKSPASSKSSPTMQVTCDLPTLSKDSNTCSQGDRQAQVPSLVTKIPSPPPARSLRSSAADTSLSASDSRLEAENSGKMEISESNVVVSTTDVPGSSVTVSVICPEVSSKARTIFWKRNKIGPMQLQSSYCNESERRVDDLDTEAGGSDICIEETDGPVNNTRHGKFMRQNNCENPVNDVGMLPGNIQGNPSRKTGRFHQLPGVDDHPVQSVVVPSQKVRNNQSPMNINAAVTGRMNQTELIGNVIGIVEEIPTAKARISKDCDSMERLGTASLTNRRTHKKNTSAGGSILNPFSGGLHEIISQEKRVSNDTSGVNADGDYSELGELLQEFSALKESLKRTEIPGGVKKMTKTFNEIGNDGNFQGDFIEGSDQKREMDMTRRYMISRDEDSSTQDFLWFKLYLKLLQSVGQVGGSRRLEILRKFEPLIPGMSLTNKRNERNEESSDSSYPGESDQGMEVDEDTNPENGAGKLRVRRRSLIMAPNVAGDGIQRDIKIETEIEPEAPDVTQNPLNASSEDHRTMNSMNYLVQAKLQCAKSELNHQFKLQKLEVEEKELRVRIAEMTIQESRLRIQALVEERLRATKIHELRIAQMAAEKVRSEAEDAARIDASCIATAEGRARINSIEIDRERSENFYQMQLRCMSTGTANGNCGVKCKQYQH